jgi:lysine 2-monooxygenase
VTTASGLEGQQSALITIFGPDFPFAYDEWLRHPAGLGSVPEAAHGATVAIVGAGLAGLVAGYELMELGLRPVVYEPTRVGGRLRSHEFEGADGIVAELGGMRFPISGTSFFHYANRVGLDSVPFPNPLTEAAGSTVVDIAGQTYQGSTLRDLPAEFTQVAQAWDEALEQISFSAL